MVVMAEDANIRIRKLDVGGTTWPNTYLFTCLQTGESALLDAQGKADLTLDQVRDRNLKYLLITHNHSGYAGELAKLRRVLKIQVCAHAEDFEKYALPLDKELRDGDILAVGRLELKVLFTPGHTDGSLCLLAGQCLFSGDTLIAGGPGYTASPADFERIMRSVTEKLFALPDETVVYPAHGNSTVLGKEKGEFALFSSRSHAAGLCGDVVWLSG